MLRMALRLARRFVGAARQQGLRAALRRTVRYVVRRACAGMPELSMPAFEAQRSELARVAEVVARHSQSIEWLAEYLGQTRLEQASPATALAAPGAPRVSVIMPVWNRANFIGRAIQSVLAQTYPHWELLVIDDGSTDATGPVARGYQTDQRIIYRYQAHTGASAARNRALAESRGDIIAYLDSDNVWYPHYLAAVIDAFDSHPERSSVYTAQLMADRSAGHAFIRAEPFSKARLRVESYFDLNVFAHRRSLFTARGGFDESLQRFLDWDLVQRYTSDSADAPPMVLPVLGGRYEDGGWDRITTCESSGRNYAMVRRKHAPPISEPLRVLYVLEHHPQLSETYVRTEMDYMRRRGVHIEAWGRLDPHVPYAHAVPVHRGSLAEAIARVQPNVVHCHWLYIAHEFAEVVARFGLPMTVRGHGFEFTPKSAQEVDQDPAVRAVFMFPHYLPQCPPGLGKLRPMNACFNPDLHYPELPKDRGMVFRAGLTKESKNLAAFVRIARRCPNHRFVMAITSGGGVTGDKVGELIALNRSVGCPVDIRVQIAHEEAAALSRKAGVYLHTYGTIDPYGMPISIAEAMASGSYIVGWGCPAAAAFIGDAGATYTTEEEAAELIRATESWTDEMWQRAELRSIDRAYWYFSDVLVLQPLLDEWEKLARASAPGSHDQRTNVIAQEQPGDPPASPAKPRIAA
ncbi:hypothetical protein AYO44_12415 [Planctomycetaceae bacterium SCGC AG-212-F19]|nr:hypothetical protein AYO44_12415 [Planctomycetaceae bacterium SCGC AG-212-F19]